MRGLLTICVTALIWCGAGDADTAFWRRFLHSLPSGWEAEGFEFGLDGAYGHFSMMFYPNAPGTDGQYLHLISDTLTVPAGIDSMRVMTCQDLEISAAGGPFGSAVAYASLTLYVNGVPQVLYYESVSGEYGSSRTLRSTEPISETIPRLHPGDVIYLRYGSGASGVNGAASGSWLLWDASLIGYSSLGLDPATWGSIKKEPGFVLLFR